MDVSVEDMYSNESKHITLMNRIKKYLFPIKTRFQKNLLINYSILNWILMSVKLQRNCWKVQNERGYLDTDLVLIADRYNLLEEEIEPILYKGKG